MANFRRGAAAIQQAAARKSGGFTHNIAWKNSGDKKFIQFLTSIEDIPTVKFHSFIVTGHHDDDPSKPMYRSFISRKDPGLDGPEGYDPLVDRFGEIPKDRCIGIAVELEPVYEAGKGGTRQIKDFNVKTREFEDKDGDTHEVPVVGAIIQSPGIFYGWLSSFAEEAGPIEDFVFSITRRGKSTDTRYDFIQVGGAVELDVPEEALVDLDAYLDELADEERMRELVGGLPDDFVVNPYSKRGEKSNSKSTSKSSGKSTRRASKPAAKDDGDEGADDGEGGEETAQPRARSSRFAQFKRDMTSKAEESAGNDGDDD